MRTLIKIIIALIVGIIIGIAATVFIYPFIFPPPQVNESIENIQSKKLVATGKFINPNPLDPIHWGKGSVEIYLHRNSQLREVYFGKDFQVGPGPAFYVYLSQGKNIKSNSEFRNHQDTNVELGALKSFKGSQIYKIPFKINLQKFKSVVVWCKTFSQLITSANLEPSQKKQN